MDWTKNVHADNTIVHMVTVRGMLRRGLWCESVMAVLPSKYTPKLPAGVCGAGGRGGARGLVVTITMIVPPPPVVATRAPLHTWHTMWPLALAAGASELFSGQLFQVTATVWKPQNRTVSERGKNGEKRNLIIHLWEDEEELRKKKDWRLRHWLGVCVCVCGSVTQTTTDESPRSHRSFPANLNKIVSPTNLPAEKWCISCETPPCVPLGQDATRTAAPVKNVSGYRSESHLWLQEGENIKDLTLTCTVATRDGTEPVWVQLFCWEHMCIIYN